MGSRLLLALRSLTPPAIGVAVDGETAGQALRRWRQHRGLSLRQLGRLVNYSHVYIWEIEKGRKPPAPDFIAACDKCLQTRGELVAATGLIAETDLDVAVEALELARRIEARDASDGTLRRLEQATDRLATAYAATPPVTLLPTVRRHLDYIAELVHARTTGAGRRRLLTVGGWLALLAATLHIDLRHRAATEAWLATAEQMAEQAGHTEIAAWCFETRAWDVLTEGRYGTALELSQQAQAVAPAGSSAMIQATAQEGRAVARLGRAAETRAALNEVARLAGNLPTPQRPEHHYVYDPAKAVSYTATTLAWVGDPAAEDFARTAIATLATEPGGVPRPRRIAAAHLDLALALLAAGKPDEAAAEATTAVASGRIVPSNWWRVNEVVDGLHRAGFDRTSDLTEAVEGHRPIR